MEVISKKAVNMALGMQKFPREINRKYRLTKGQYNNSEIPKKSIILHHTCGETFQGAFSWWEQTPGVIGTAYIIDVTGEIYEVFNPKTWAYHVGSKTTQYFDKTSVGIEIVSPGGVFKVDNEFVFYPLFPNISYKKIIPADKVVELEEEYRGFKYYVKYTDEQIVSVTWLVAQLVKTLGIDVSKFTPEFYQYSEEVLKNKLPGIWSHSTLRKDKPDIYPCKELIEALDYVMKAMKKKPL